MAKNTVMIYACGGAGANISKRLEKFRGGNIPGLAQAKIAYINTSNSDYDDDVAHDAIYITEGTDGSGKDRGENNQLLKNAVPNILGTFKPADLNIVVTSGGGGTGGVAANHILNELTARGVPTIIIVIGSVGSAKEVNNTVNTLKSIERTCQVQQKPVVIQYYQNDTVTPKSMVDAAIEWSITRLLVLASGENKHFDAADLKNWLNYEKVSAVSPQLTTLDILSKSDLDTLQKSNLVTMAVLATSGMDTENDLFIDYQATGYVGKDVFAPDEFKEPVYFVTKTGVVNTIDKKLKEILQQFKEVRGAAVRHTPIVDKDDSGVDDDIFI